MSTLRTSCHAVAFAFVIACNLANGTALAAERSTYRCSASMSVGTADPGDLCKRRVAQLAPPEGTPSAPVQSNGLLPADRMIRWKPGLMAVGGIPNRTTVYKTLSPSGRDDSNLIQIALETAPPGQVVMLSPGTFIVNNLLLIRRPVTLRGSGAGVTKLVKTNGAKPRTSTVISGTKGIFAPVDIVMTRNRSSLLARRAGTMVLTAPRLKICSPTGFKDQIRLRSPAQ
jgi:hypothetical protein